MSFFVYILASRRNGTLYIGMTDNLARRYWEHLSGAVPGFTKKYREKPRFNENANSKNGSVPGRSS
jgi:putative endonuclease